MNKTNYIIQAVSHALDLLEQFQQGDTEFGITELSNRLKLQKNNVFRLLATLKSRHYIDVNTSTGKYRLGLKTRELGQAAIQQTNFINLARPVLQSLKEQSGETCYFSVIRNAHTYYLDGIETDLPVRVVHRIGSRRPLHCTAAGKVHLAYMSPDELNRFFSSGELVRFTARTTTNKITLQGELAMIAAQGYSVEDQEHDSGVIELAAPVFDRSGSIVGALSISAPTMRVTGSRLARELVPLVCREATGLSGRICLGNFDSESDTTAFQPRETTGGSRKLPVRPHMPRRTKSVAEPCQTR